VNVYSPGEEKVVVVAASAVALPATEASRPAVAITNTRATWWRIELS
jgi:hypothetical protein